MYGLTNYQSIWSQIDQLEVWRDILNPGISLYQLTTNPFRPDSHPNCYLRDRGGLLLFTDFAYPAYNKFTCIHAVAEIFGCTLDMAAQHVHNIYISKMYSLHQATSRPQTKLSTIRATDNPGRLIHFIPFTQQGKACYTNLDREYWQKRFVSSRQLEKLNVFSVHHYWIGSQIYYPTHPAYAYYFPTTAHVKIYIPAKKEFFGTVTTTDIWKVDRGSNVCVITKSAKDVLVLENLLPDYDIHAFQSEGVVPDLTPYRDYDKVIIFYDNDTTGIEKSRNLRLMLTNAVEICIPSHLNSKDSDELVVHHGFNFAQDTVHNLIENATKAHAHQLVGQFELYPTNPGFY